MCRLQSVHAILLVAVLCFQESACLGNTHFHLHCCHLQTSQQQVTIIVHCWHPCPHFHSCLGCLHP